MAKENPFMLNCVEGLRYQADEQKHQQAIEYYAERRRIALREAAYWAQAIRDENEQHEQIKAALAAKEKAR